MYKGASFRNGSGRDCDNLENTPYIKATDQLQLIFANELTDLWILPENLEIIVFFMLLCDSLFTSLQP